MAGSAAQFDTVIIGGGIVGAACAYALRKQKPDRQLMLIEGDRIGGGTTSAAAGLASLLTKQPDFHMRLAAESIRLHLDWNAREALSPLHRCGLLLVFENEGESKLGERQVEEVRRYEPWVSRLTPSQVSQMEPNYVGPCFGALHSPESFRVDPVELTKKWVERALDGKVCFEIPEPGAEPRFRLDAMVDGLEPHGEGWQVHTDAGSFTAQRVIVAAGLDTVGLLAPLGWHLPIRPRRGQIERTRPLRGLLKRSIIASNYVSDKFDTHPPADEEDESALEYSFAVIVDENTRLWIGSSRRFSPDGSLRADERVRMLYGALQRLRNFSIDTVDLELAGRRPWSPDGLPLIGRLPDCPNLFVAAGHEGDGVTLAPITGQIITSMIDDLSLRINPAPVRPDRFGRRWVPADAEGDTLS